MSEPTSLPEPAPMSRLCQSIVGAVALIALAGCNPFAGPAAGSRHYDTACASCHGSDARGTAAGPDLTRIAARNDGEYPRRAVLDRLDGYGRGTVREGGAMPDLSHLMTGRLMRVDLGRNASRMMPERIVALAAYLESIQR